MDSFKTIRQTTEEILFKEKKSKFYAQAFLVADEETIKNIIETLRKLHPNSGHVCYAYRIHPVQPKWRANDDGEPNNSAGMPIYGQIQSHELYNVLVTVTRYFGGVKLGVGGLISAYKTAAQMALESAEIIEKTIEKTFTLTFDYAQMNKVMRIIKEKSIIINNQNLTENCQLSVTVSMLNAQAFRSWFADVFPAIKISE